MAFSGDEGAEGCGEEHRTEVQDAAAVAGDGGRQPGTGDHGGHGVVAHADGGAVCQGGDHAAQDGEPAVEDGGVVGGGFLHFFSLASPLSFPTPGQEVNSCPGAFCVE